MSYRSPLSFLLVLAALFAVPPGADARYRVGIGDQYAQMFDHPRFQELGLKRVRYIVPWDWRAHAFQVEEVTTYMNKALGQGKEVHVAFSARRGCFNNGRYSKAKACRAPSVRAYTRAVKDFDATFPAVNSYATWNEANDKSQPTDRKPALVAKYYKAFRKACKRCRIMAADVLDEAGMRSWLRAFQRRAGKSAKLWGLHNYPDVNRRRTKGTQTMLATVPGEVWLTETGGLVKFLPNFPFNPKRAANRTRFMFKLADRFQRRRPGLRSKITRLYYYKWTGVDRNARFDAGLTNPDGSVRPAYKVFKREAAKRPK